MSSVCGWQQRSIARALCRATYLRHVNALISNVSHAKLALHLIRCESFSTVNMSKGQLREIEIEPGVQGLELTEGKAIVHLKKDQGVFYNPVQCFNRDISTAVINEHLRQRKNFIIKNNKTTWDTQASILEALAASGLRSIRYARELDSDILKEIVANDISKSAVESIRKNAELNSVGDKIRPNLGDAILFMHQSKAENKYFDVVDLDPYGCAAKFLDSAVQVVQNKGLLCVTATDMAILCGNTPETCRAKYGSVPLKAKFCHEMALRILLCSIETAANRHGRFITPLVSISVDFYIRVFVRVETSALKVKQSSSKMALVYVCNRCENYHLQPLGTSVVENDTRFYKNSRGPPVGPNCENCGSTFTLGGPIYTDPMHDRDFVASLQTSLKDATQLETTDLPNFEANRASSEDVIPVNETSRSRSDSLAVTKFQTLRRMQGILSVISEELPDVPLHLAQEKLSQLLRTHSVPMIKLRSALMNAGYRVSTSHTNKTSVKTDAPHEVVWDIMRQWVIDHKIDNCKDKEAKTIMSHPIKTKVDFTERADAVAPSMKDKSLRFQLNPERNWGPKARATASDDVEEKRKRLQGKKKKRREVTQVNGADHESPLDASVEEEDAQKQLKKSRHDEQILLENKGQTA